MVKKSKNSLKSKSKNKTKPKKNLDIKKSKREKRKIINKLYDKNEYETDLSFIDVFEENEKKRLKIKENENLFKILNKISYILQICYRPTTNNIELIGEYHYNQENNINNNKNIKNNNEQSYNKCSYLLIQNNIIVAPILNTNILNNDLNHNNNKINNDVNNNSKNKKKTNSNITKNRRNQTTKKAKNKQFLYVHISKKNLINCLLLDEYTLIDHILIFLSGIYSGYFEEKNKNNSSILKVDSFNLFLNNNNSINNNDDNFYNIEVFGKGKDEYGEYIIKGNMILIHNLEQYQKENENININNSKVIYFGNVNFHKIYNI